MKNRWLLVIGVVVVIEGLCLSTTAEAREQKITGSFSGSIATTVMDVNSDGVASLLSTVRGKSSFGMTSAQTIGENAPRLSTVSACPPNNMEFPLLMAHSVIHFDDTGDLLFATYSSGVTCFDPSTGMFTTKGKGSFTGGTGTLTNATGDFEATSRGKGIVRDRTGHEFDYLTGEFSGTLFAP